MPRTNTGPRLALNANEHWEIRWSEKGRSRRKSTGFHRFEQRDAEKYLAWWLQEGRTLQERDPAGKPMTVARLWDQYITERVPGRSSRQEAAWNHMRAFFGGMAPEDVDAERVAAYVAQRLDTPSARTGKPPAVGTVRKEVDYLRAALNHAFKRRRIPGSALHGWDLPDPGPRRERWLSAEEIDRLLAAAAAETAKPRHRGRLSRIERFVHLALQTAARRRAIETLMWAQVNFDRRIIDFRPPAGSPLWRPNKTKRRPVVPISDALLPVLRRAWDERLSDDGFVLDTPAELRSPWESVRDAAGLSDGQVCIHTLRHTWATHAAMNGVSLEDIALVLGDTIAMVEKVYRKFQPEYLHRAVNWQPVRFG